MLLGVVRKFVDFGNSILRIFLNLANTSHAKYKLCTDVGVHTQSLLHDSATCATFLAVEMWCYSNDRDSVHQPHQSIGFHPGNEHVPSCIMNGLGNLSVGHCITPYNVYDVKQNQSLHRKSHREMRRACLPFCGQSLHAAIGLSDALLPVVSWLSYGCYCSFACVMRRAATALSVVRFYDNAGACLECFRQSLYSMLRGPHQY